MVRAAWVAVALALIGGCSRKSDERPLLPWLQERTTVTKFGELGTSKSTVYEVRYYGFWRNVEAEYVTVLDKQTILVHRKSGVFLLQRGELAARAVCSLPAFAAVPPYAESVDCISVVEQRGRGAARIGWKRISARGDVTARGEINVEDERHVLSHMDVFYDDQAHPYFLTLLEKAFNAVPMRGDCALVGWGDAGPVVAARLPDAPSSATCRNAEAWTQALGKRLSRDGRLPARSDER